MEEIMTKVLSFGVNGVNGYPVHVEVFAVGGIPARVKEYAECCQNGTRPSWCPLFPVPDHGRLIDADALAEEHRVRAHQGMTENSYSVHTIAKAWVDEAPTIIPADKEDEP